MTMLLLSRGRGQPHICRYAPPSLLFVVTTISATTMTSSHCARNAKVPPAHTRTFTREGGSMGHVRLGIYILKCREQYLMPPSGRCAPALAPAQASNGAVDGAGAYDRCSFRPALMNPRRPEAPRALGALSRSLQSASSAMVSDRSSRSRNHG